MNAQWHVGKPSFVFIYGPNGEEIARVSTIQFVEREARAIAAQIVREHNAHDELVAALRKAESFVAGFDGADCEETQAVVNDILTNARAALAKAGAA